MLQISLYKSIKLLKKESQHKCGIRIIYLSIKSSNYVNRTWYIISCNPVLFAL